MSFHIVSAFLAHIVCFGISSADDDDAQARVIISPGMIRAYLADDEWVVRVNERVAKFVKPETEWRGINKEAGVLAL